MQIKTNVSNLGNYRKYLRVIRLIKNYLDNQNYLEIDLPVLAPALVPESYLEVFETEFKYHQDKKKLYLTPSPELFLKRLLAYGGFDCYYLGKSFRNSESYSDLHSFEFTMLEFYKTKSDYFGIAGELLKMLAFVSQQVSGKNYIYYNKKKVSFEKWEKISVMQAFKTYAGIEESELFNHKLLLEQARDKGYKVDGFTYEDIFSQIYTQEIELHLGFNGYPTLLYDYPKEFAALAKLNPDGKTAQRFEFYICGIELGDCYTELTDWQEQKQRFKDEDRLRQKLGRTKHPVDTGFIEALKHGLVDCAGIAIGVERLAMIFTNVDSIHDLKMIDVY